MSKGKAITKGLRTLLQKEGKQKKPIIDDRGKPIGRDKTTPESKDARAPKSKQTKKQVKADTAAKARIGKAKDVKREMQKRSKSVIQERDTRPKKNTLSKLDQKEIAYDELLIGVQRKLISKQRKGEPATYQGTDYSDVLSKRKGIKSQVTKKQIGGRLKADRLKELARKAQENKRPLTKENRERLQSLKDSQRDVRGKKQSQHANKNKTLKKKPKTTPAKGLRGMGVALRGGGKVMKR